MVSTHTIGAKIRAWARATDEPHAFNALIVITSIAHGRMDRLGFPMCHTSLEGGRGFSIIVATLPVISFQLHVFPAQIDIFNSRIPGNKPVDFFDAIKDVLILFEIA